MGSNILKDTINGMVKEALLLVSCNPGKADYTKKSLDELPQIKTSSVVEGAYDIVAKINGPTLKDLKDVIIWKIHKMPSVRSILTLEITK